MTIIEALKKITTECPDAVIGGSVCLKAWNLIDREVGDIDVFVQKTASSGILPLPITGLMLSNSNFISETTTDMNGVNIRRIGCNMGGVKVCVFFVDKAQLEHDWFIVSGVKVKIQNPKWAIQAKCIYAARPGDHNQKHRDDLDVIFKNINNGNQPYRTGSL